MFKPNGTLFHIINNIDGNIYRYELNHNTGVVYRENKVFKDKVIEVYHFTKNELVSLNEQIITKFANEERERMFQDSTAIFFLSPFKPTMDDILIIY